MIKLSIEETVINEKLLKLKSSSGSHSPSIFTLAKKIDEIKISIDACFLSNPYATDVFLDYFKKELLDTGKLRDCLEFYPSQNYIIAEYISKIINVSKEYIVVGNGAIEMIQTVLHNFVSENILINIPTFSSYYEFLNSSTRALYFELNKENDFNLNVNEYIEFVKKNKIKNIVLINPNNPDGGYIPYEDLLVIISSLKELDNIIIDESFVHFAYESEELEMKSVANLVSSFDNLVIIKSMSKDFGIAGIRCGYCIMNKERVSKTIRNGFLWNSSGLAEYFFELYSRKEFLNQYEVVRRRYIRETQIFLQGLESIPQIKVYPTKANFALVELTDGTKASTFVAKLLLKNGIYVRNCNDKIGLKGEFVRIASRTYDENRAIIKAIKELFTHREE